MIWSWIESFFKGLNVVGGARSGAWDRLRDTYLQGKSCQACGGDNALEAHHILPFHSRPELELDPCNLIALCRRCHFVFGHLGCWQCHNPEVARDAAEYLSRVEQYRGDHHGKP